jgi:microcystin-dependent protein
MIVTNQTTNDLYFGPLHLAAGIGTTLTVDDTTATSLYLTNDSVAEALNNAYIANKILVSSQAQPFPRPTGEPALLHGTGSPEGLVFAAQGSVYMRRDGLQTNGGVLYSKTTGASISTGWVDIPTASGASVASPVGTLVAFGGATAPSGWLICDGSAVSRTTYGSLFGVVGTFYGTGDGSTTFNLPDLRGRVAAGYAASGGHVDVSTLGLNDGTALASRRPKHKQTVNDSGHVHRNKARGAAGGSQWGVPATFADGQAGQYDPNPYMETIVTGVTVGPQTGAEPTDAPAYVVVNHIIKT